jgi:hypothetical protein
VTSRTFNIAIADISKTAFNALQSQDILRMEDGLVNLDQDHMKTLVKMADTIQPNFDRNNNVPTPFVDASTPVHSLTTPVNTMIRMIQAHMRDQSCGRALNYPIGNNVYLHHEFPARAADRPVPLANHVINIDEYTHIDSTFSGVTVSGMVNSVVTITCGGITYRAPEGQPLSIAVSGVNRDLALNYTPVDAAVANPEQQIQIQIDEILELHNITALQELGTANEFIQANALGKIASIIMVNAGAVKGKAIFNAMASTWRRFISMLSVTRPMQIGGAQEGALILPTLNQSDLMSMGGLRNWLSRLNVALGNELNYLETCFAWIIRIYALGYIASIDTSCHNTV